MTLHMGGEGNPARDGTHEPSRAGHIVCCICCLPIPLDQYRTARVWCDPHSITCAAHAACLTWIGEHDLGLPPAA